MAVFPMTQRQFRHLNILRRFVRKGNVIVFSSETRDFKKSKYYFYGVLESGGERPTIFRNDWKYLGKKLA